MDRRHLDVFFISTVFPPFLVKTVPVWLFSVRNVEMVSEVRQLEGSFSKNIAPTQMQKTEIHVCHTPSVEFFDWKAFQMQYAKNSTPSRITAD